MQLWWNDTGRGEAEVLGAKHVALSLCPPQIPHGGAWNRTRATDGTGRRLALVVSRP